MLKSLFKEISLRDLGYTPWRWLETPLSGVTYICDNESVVIVKLKSKHKCGGLFINDVPMLVDLSSDCEIHLKEGDTFCVHACCEISDYKVFEKVPPNASDLFEELKKICAEKSKKQGLYISFGQDMYNGEIDKIRVNASMCGGCLMSLSFEMKSTHLQEAIKRVRSL